MSTNIVSNDTSAGAHFRGWDIDPDELDNLERPIRDDNILANEYYEYVKLYNGSQLQQTVEHSVGSIPSVIKIRQCICFGVGNFGKQTLWPAIGLPIKEKGRDGKKDEFIRFAKPAMNQLVCFIEFVKAMRRKGHPIDKILYQDPGFSSWEKQCLRNRKPVPGVTPTVAETDTEAMEGMNNRTFLFAVGVEPQLVAKCLNVALPGLYIGTHPNNIIHTGQPSVKAKDLKAVRGNFKEFRDATTGLQLDKVKLDDYQDTWVNDLSFRCLA